MAGQLPQRPFTQFRALSFDCYGTLIDWETGIAAGLEPLLAKLPSNHRYVADPKALTRRLDVLTHDLEPKEPRTPYHEILSRGYGTIAEEEGVSVSEAEKAAFGQSAGSWAAFSDTVPGLKLLKKHYKLIILSNVDNANVQRTLSGPLAGVEFDAVYTAEDIGSYKPSHDNFTHLLSHLKSDFGLEQVDLLHVAKSLPADHVPAKEIGLTSVWIARGLDGTSIAGGALKEYEGRVAFSWRFPTIGAFAEAVEKDFAARDG